ncbi:MAG: hypothetical protein NXI10_14155 [bacterium]|nr:hypothetical protein [bacterium]
MKAFQGYYLLTLLVVIFSSCAPYGNRLRGEYVPLQDGENPYYETKETLVVSRMGDTVVRAYHVPNPRIRPYYDTITFVSRNRVKALHRSSGVGSCCASPIYMTLEEYEMNGDTMKAPYGNYLVRGDTLYPLHYGKIYVKE